MNVSKRLVTVLTCIAMVISMMSSFAFALGGAGTEVTDASNVAAAPGVVGDSSTVGPNPTSNVALPAITNNTIVYDSSAKDNTYTLNFTDKSTGEAVDTFAWTANYNTNLFNSMQSAIIQAAKTSGVILVMSDSYNILGDTVVSDFPANSTVKLYSQYYNVMPYDIAGTAKDGSDWTLNSDFVNNAPKFTWGDIPNSAEYHFYGVTFSNYINTVKATQATPMKMHLENVYCPLKKYFLMIDFKSDQTDKSFGKEGSSFTLKNAWIEYNSTYNILYEFQPDTIVFDGVFWNNVASTAQNTWTKQLNRNSEITFRNCNFQNVKTNFIFQGGASTSAPTSYTRSLNFENNIFYNSHLGTGHASGTNKNAVLGRIYFSAYNIINVKNNIFISTDNTAVMFADYGQNASATTVNFSRNILNGVNPQINIAEMGHVLSASSVVNDNFATAQYTEDLSSATGVAVTATGSAALDASKNFNWFLDSDMTVSASGFAIASIDAGNTGSVTFSNNDRAVTWLRTSGSAADLKITGASDAAFTWHTSADGAAVDPSTIISAGTYYLKASYGGYSLVYTVTVVSSANMFTDTWQETDGIKNTALFVDLDSASTAAGSVYTGTWKGTEYEFIKGVNVFDRVDSAIAYAAANSIENAQILVKKSNETHIYATYPASFYTQNYNINPVISGGAEASAWSANPAFDRANAVKFDGISVESTAAVGDYIFNGFVITYDIANKSTTRDVNMYVNNVYVTTASGNGIFGGNASQSDASQQAYKNTSNKLVVKNMYMTVTGTGVPRFFQTGPLPTEFVIDNAFFDVPEGKNTAPFYVNTYSDVSSITIKNSYLKNLRYSNEGYFEGSNAAAKTGNSRTFTIDNNIFENSCFNAIATFRMYAGSFTGFAFTNNTVINAEGSEIPILHSSNRNGSDGTPVDFDLVIKNNKIINGVATMQMAGRKLSDASDISANYMLTADGIANINVNNTFFGASYYLDEAMTTLNTDVELVSAKLKPGVEGSLVLNNTARTLTYYCIDSAASLADFDITFPEGATVIFAEDEDGEKALSDEDFKIYGQYNGPYYIVSTAEGKDISIAYEIIFEAPSENLFGDKFEDEAGLIDASKAFLIAKDDNLTAAADGAVVTISWCGEDYDFIKGLTAFTSVAAAEAYTKEKGIDTPHFLVIGKTEGDNFLLTAPAHVFTQNYKNNPVNKGTAKDGSDWSANFGTGEGQFDTTSGVDVIYHNVGAYYWNDDTIDYPAGEYWFYGFSLRYAFLDKTNTTGTDVRLINSRYITSNWANDAITANNLMAVDNKIGIDSSFTMQNVYIGLSNNDTHGIIVSGTVHNHFTLDGVFIDVPSGGGVCTSESTLTQRCSDTSYTIKNSLFKNYLTKQVVLSTGTNVAAGDSRSINLENNIFINSMFRTTVNGASYDGLVCFKADEFTKLNIKDNYVSRPEGLATWSTTGPTSNIEGAPLEIVLENNYFEGLTYSKQSIDGRNLAETSVIRDNYTNGTYFRAVGKVKSLYSETWYLDAEMTKLSNKVYDGYTFNGNDFTSEMTYSVGAKDVVADISALIDANGNVIRAYSDEDCETAVNLAKVPVATKGTTVYLKVMSPDAELGDATETKEETYKLTITREAGAYLSNEGKGSTADALDETKYWVSWRGEYIVTGEDAEVDTTKHRVGAIYFSDVVTDEETGKTNLDEIKQAIIDGMAEAESIDAVDTVIPEINDGRGNIDRVLVLRKEKTLTWNNETQSYGYYYNFNIPADYYRGVIMYAVYEDADGNIQVTFSNGVVQQSGK